MTADLPARFRAHVETARLFQPPGRAVLAVSGGADSLALLELMGDLAPEAGLELVVGHVDHGILAGSGLVAEEVRAYAERHGCEFRLTCLGLGSDASETVAREARYAALRTLQHDVGARYIVTAHHADDQIETVLFRVLRGSAPLGLAGMMPRQRDGLVRPLLPFRRDELREWLATRPGITPFEDPANQDRRHDRVWIRQELLPALRARHGDIGPRLLGLAEYAARDRRAWADLLRVLPGLDPVVGDASIEVARPPLQAYDTPLRQAVLRAAAFEVGCGLGPRRAERLAAFVASAESGRRFEIGSGWACDVAFDRIRLFSPPGGGPPGAPVRWGEADSGRAEWGAWSLAWRPDPAGDVKREGWTTWVTPGPGQIRPARPGDKLVPLGGTGRRPVARLLMEGRVARADRAAFPVVVRGDEILWLPGICRADTARPPRGSDAVRLDASRG